MAGVNSMNVSESSFTAFRNMSSAIDICINSFKHLDKAASTGIDVTNISIACSQMEEMSLKAQEVSASIEKSNENQKKFGEIISKVFQFDNLKQVLNLSDTIAQNTAKINQMNDGLQSSDQLTKMIYQSAQNSRGAYQTTADAIIRMGTSAKEAFHSNQEAVAFVELLNKSLKLSGADAQGADAIMSQLTEAMSSGGLKEDGWNNIMGNAQPIAASIQEYLEEVEGIDTSNMARLASEGVLTANVLKNAMFYASDEINEQFNSLPYTWEDIGNRIKNTAIMAFQPVLQKINEIANSQWVTGFVNGFVGAFSILSNVGVQVLNILTQAGAWVYDNWDLLRPIILGVAIITGIYTALLAANSIALAFNNTLSAISAIQSVANGTAKAAEAAATTSLTAAQISFNAALLACPLTWIVIAIIAVVAAIYVVTAAINQCAGTSISATGMIMGTFATVGAFLANLGYSLMELVFGIINYLANKFIIFANFFANVFLNPISSVIYLFQALGDNVLGIIEKIASAIDYVFGTNLAAGVASWRAGLKDMADAAVEKFAPDESYEKVFDEINLSAEGTFGFKRYGYDSSFDAGYDYGQGLAEKATSAFKGFGDLGMNSFDYSQLTDAAANTADNTKSTADSASKVADNVEMTSEEIKYLRDIAEQNAINQFTTVPLSLTVQNTNHINNELDIDTVCNAMTNRLYEEMQMSGEGIHS